VRRSWIGVRVETLANNPTLREHLQGIDAGVVVDTIEANAPAFKSDLRPTDVITQVDGVPISLAKDLQTEIVRKKIGQVVQLNVWRAGRIMQIPVTTGELPSNFTKVSTAPASKALVPNSESLGMKLKAEEKRAVVSEVTAESPAAKAGLQAGDIITDVESKPVASPGAVFDAITAGAGKGGKKGVLLNVERKGKRTFVVLEPGG
jgi:S1-C subfamily serine protease